PNPETQNPDRYKIPTGQNPNSNIICQDLVPVRILNLSRF
ncbi:18587_t:CDS:2, partial [Funneliformis geosporum]